jgi:hypothetical protein
LNFYIFIAFKNQSRQRGLLHLPLPLVVVGGGLQRGAAPEGSLPFCRSTLVASSAMHGSKPTNHGEPRRQYIRQKKIFGRITLHSQSIVDHRRQ